MIRSRASVRAHPSSKITKMHSTEERSLILSQFKDQLVAGLSATEAAKKLGVSLSSLYRWKARDEDVDVDKMLARVNGAIKVMASGSDARDAQLLYAIFMFTAWLRFPSSDKHHDPAVLSCLLTYYTLKFHAETLADIPGDELKSLLPLIRTLSLRRLFSSETIDFYPLQWQQIDDQPHTERDVIADLFWFLIACDLGPRDRGRASLTKAYRVLKEGCFRYKWDISRRTFDKSWATYGSAAPFYYIATRHCALDFDFDPSAEDFVKAVDDVLEQPESLRTFLANCKWAIERMKSRLDPRAIDRLHFPSFPKSLSAEAVEPETPPDRANKMEWKYESGEG